MLFSRRTPIVHRQNNDTSKPTQKNLKGQDHNTERSCRL